MTFIEQNPNRLIHLLSLFKMTQDELLDRINIGLKKRLTANDIFGDKIKISTLKKIDGIFDKGFSYYTDPVDPSIKKDESIFFRKNDFNADLSLGAKQVVNKYEEEKLRFSILAKSADFKIKRKLPIYKTSDVPKEVAIEIRPKLYPDFSKEKRDFLSSFIEKLAEYNVVVYEFVETHNKKEKANIDGFYLTPNVIVLKRVQKYFSREIFTLAHELGHYLLNEEDIDDKIWEDVSKKENLNDHNNAENWCNDFAYYFLVGDYDSIISEISVANAKNDYHNSKIRQVSEKTHLSTISLYTRLLIGNKISYTDYQNVKNEILFQIQERENKLKEEREIEKQKLLASGKKPFGMNPTPIISPLLLDTMRLALDTGLINEYEFCKRLNINPKKIEDYYA